MKKSATANNSKLGIAITFPDGNEHCFLLTAKMVSIGRGSENQISIPCGTVSTSHCELRLRGKNDFSYEVRDLDSTNGTTLNGEEIGNDDYRELRNGDILMIGLDIKARFFHLREISDDSRAPSPDSPSIEAISGAVTAKLRDVQRSKNKDHSPRREPSINPVAAAVARASSAELEKN